MPDVTCTLFGGNAQIGGNKILLRDGAIDLFLDFGMNFEANGRYFAEFLSPRGSTSGTYDYLMMGIIPPVSGIYRPDAAVEAPTPSNASGNARRCSMRTTTGMTIAMRSGGRTMRIGSWSTIAAPSPRAIPHRGPGTPGRCGSGMPVRRR